MPLNALHTWPLAGFAIWSYECDREVAQHCLSQASALVTVFPVCLGSHLTSSENGHMTFLSILWLVLSLCICITLPALIICWWVQHAVKLGLCWVNTKNSLSVLWKTFLFVYIFVLFAVFAVYIFSHSNKEQKYILVYNPTYNHLPPTSASLPSASISSSASVWLNKS